MMDRDTKEVVVIIIAAALVVVVVVAGLFTYSGMNRPLTVVESNSMQHSDDTSYLGIIDTGDMVVMLSPEKTNVTTFVEGQQNGHYKFGSYGDVIIYYRANKNPVIHRAILWLDYNTTTSKWSAPALENYPKDLWDNNGSWDWNDLSGNLTLRELPYKNSTIDLTINLNNLAHDDSGYHSGYLTKGDNNAYFDQTTTIHYEPVEKSELKAVSGLEIPWLGCIKLLVKDKNTNMIPGNSKTCLFILFIDIIAFIAMISMILDYRRHLRMLYD